MLKHAKKKKTDGFLQIIMKVNGIHNLSMNKVKKLGYHRILLMSNFFKSWVDSCEKLNFSYSSKKFHTNLRI